MGSIRFDVPFAAPSIAVVSEAAGLMSDSDGQTPRTAVRTTVIDTADHRLLRSGIVLAHHLSDSVGHWSLEAPAWAPRSLRTRWSRSAARWTCPTASAG